MIAEDEDALICDLAETYHIYNYRSLPMRLVATFSLGLRENSRIKRKMRGEKVAPEILLLASAVDRLSLLVYSNTRDAQKGWNKPQMLVDILLSKSKNDDLEVFNSGAEFELKKAEILGGA